MSVPLVPVRRRVRALLVAFQSDEQGSAVVEFSLVAMLMIVLVFGTIDWARFFLLRGQIADAVRDSARYAATKTESSDDSASVVNYARTLMANSTTDSTAGTMTVSYAGTAGTDRRVRVALAGFPFVRTTPLVIGASRTINVAAEFRREQP